MNAYSIYDDIRERTNGEIYMAVVGPVRTGKSTFIRRFSELLIIPNSSMEAAAEVIDQLPVSGSGATITTVEPKFIPKAAVSINLADETNPKVLKIRLIDCVGYMVDGAKGHYVDGAVRMVKTPWSDEEIPFTDAADIGTGKVIYEHSTLATVITTDGSISEIPREAYTDAEERTISALREASKPFIIILNTLRPFGIETKRLAGELEEKYAAPVLPINLEQLKEEDIEHIFEQLISMFPTAEISFELPDYFFMLDENDEIRVSIMKLIKRICDDISCMKDIKDCYNQYLISDGLTTDKVRTIRLMEQRLESGRARISIELDRSIYYEFLSSLMGCRISDEGELLETLVELTDRASGFKLLEGAWEEAHSNGYGVVTPCRNEIVIHEPEITCQGNRYGIRVHATAPCTHFIKTEIETELAPLVGTRAQAEELLEHIKNGENNEKLWDIDIFGKSMGRLVEEGLEARVASLDADGREKLRASINKIVNESCNFVCFIV